MKVLQSGGGKIAVEFSTDEYLLLRGIVYTADTFFENLDPCLYDIEKKQVTAIANALFDITKPADFRP